MLLIFSMLLLAQDPWAYIWWQSICILFISLESVYCTQGLIHLLWYYWIRLLTSAAQPFLPQLLHLCESGPLNQEQHETLREANHSGYKQHRITDVWNSSEEKSNCYNHPRQSKQHRECHDHENSKILSDLLWSCCILLSLDCSTTISQDNNKTRFLNYLRQLVIMAWFGLVRTIYLLCSLDNSSNWHWDRLCLCILTLAIAIARWLIWCMFMNQS